MLTGGDSRKFKNRVGFNGSGGEGLGTMCVIFPRWISMNVTNDVCGLSELPMVRGQGRRRRDSGGKKR